MGTIAPPPTWANPGLEQIDPATGKTKIIFNPEWLKWFLELSFNLQTVPSGGGSSPGGGTAQFSNTVGPNPPGFVVNNIVVFDNPVTGPPPSPFCYIKDSGKSITDFIYNFADNEVPTGVIDGVNDTFTLAHNPDPSTSVIIYHTLAGEQPSVLNGHFVVSGGNVVTFTVPPLAGDVLYAYYRYLIP